MLLSFMCDLDFYIDYIDEHYRGKNYKLRPVSRNYGKLCGKLVQYNGKEQEGMK